MLSPARRPLPILIGAALVVLLTPPPSASAAPQQAPAPQKSRAAQKSPAAQKSRAAQKATPAACASNGAYVWSHLRRCGWPSAATTGPNARRCPGDRLRTRGTDPQRIIHVTRPNATLSCRRIVGCLRIEAPGVRLRDLAVRCTSGRTGEDANGTAVIDVRPGASARISRVATNGMRGVHACV